jgi:hypothetical protein
LRKAFLTVKETTMAHLVHNVGVNSSSTFTHNTSFVSNVTFGYDFFPNLASESYANISYITDILSQHGFTVVSTQPTHAAFIPLWPELLVGWVLGFWLGLRLITYVENINRYDFVSGKSS